MPNYTELVDLFLTFLLPEHATEVGRFFENFVFNNMSNLLQKLNFYFNKQPQHMRKIFTCLNELSNDPEITLERLKTKFQPLLKGNQLLIDWFDQLFEKPPASLNPEFECVYIKKSLSDSENSIDSYYEEIHSKDLVDGDNVDELNSCGVRYKNGKIMYQGILLPGKISFLAHDSVSVPPKEKRDPKSLCVHQLRKHVKFDDTKAIKESEKPESSSKKSAKKAVKKHKLCDAQTLHAHAVRLNSVHAQNGEKLSDLTYLLTPPKRVNGSSDSPKKARSVKRGAISPKKNKSPSSSSGNSVSPSSGSPSKAVQTAKKLRNLVNDDEQPTKKRKVADNQDKTSRADKKKKTQKANDTAAALKKAEPETKPDNIDSSDSKSESSTRWAGDWTRDEDKLILEKINNHNREDLLRALLPELKRSRSEISSRYDFLLDIIKMHKKQ
jgi:hypothetical protein